MLTPEAVGVNIGFEEKGNNRLRMSFERLYCDSTIRTNGVLGDT